MIRVAFTGGSARAGPLTLAQHNVLRSMRHQATDGHNFTLWLTVPVPPETTTDAVVEALHGLMLRHESLRTTYRLGPDPEQRVAGSGEIALQVYEAGDGPDEMAHDLVARLSATRIEVTHQLPLRGALVTSGGLPARIVLVVSHLAVDAASVEVLRRDLLGSGPAGAVRAGPPARQPLDQAAAESTEPAHRRAAAALDHWRALLSRGPQCTFAVPPQPAAAPHRMARAPHRMARLRSTALARAAATVAARTSTSGSATVLAAVAALVGHHTGHAECVVTAVAGNRHMPELRDFVGPLAQDALISFDLGGPFDALVRRVWAASLTGYRHTRFDAAALWQTIEETGYARGTSFARDFVFNDRSGFAGAHRPRGSTASQFAWLPAPDLPTRFVCYVNRLDREAELVMWADVTRLPPARLELALRGVERLLVEAAAREVDVADVGKLTGLDAVDRGPGWFLVDSCWIELDEVRRLVRDALGAYEGEVFVIPDRGLVAYLSGDDLDPVPAHRACMAALPGRETAMAPHWYVGVAGRPADPRDLSAWQALRLTAQGSGRGGPRPHPHPA